MARYGFRRASVISGLFRSRGAWAPTLAPWRFGLLHRSSAGELVAAFRVIPFSARLRSRDGLTARVGLKANVQEREEEVQHTAHSTDRVACI